MGAERWGDASERDGVGPRETEDPPPEGGPRSPTARSRPSIPSRTLVVTDSTADMDRDEVARLGIEVVPHSIHWNGDIYRDGVDLTIDGFYRMLREKKGTPRTSQLSPGQLAAVYRRLLGSAGGVVSLHLSSQLSGTFNSARLAAEQVAPDRVVVIDSLTLSGSLGMLVTRVAALARRGASSTECAALAEELIPRLRLVIVLDTVEFLRRGGRIGRVQAVAASILSVKPIIQVVGGVFLPMARVRTRAMAIQRVAELVGDLGRLEEVRVLYGDDPQPAAQLLQLIREDRPEPEVRLGRTGSACGAHAGPGVFGAAILLAD